MVAFYMRSKHLQDDHHTVYVRRNMRRARRKAQEQRWRRQARSGLRVMAAIMLLTLGVLLPFVSELNRERWAAAMARSQPGEQASSAPPSAPAGAPAAQAAGAQPAAAVGLVATLEATAALPATVIPIVPTLRIASEAGQPTPTSEPPGSGIQAGMVPAGQSRPGPILMYHYIRSVDAASDPLGYNLSVSPELFESHMAWLANDGYTGVDLQTLLRCTGRMPVLQANQRCPASPVALTFDDGYMDAYTAALPILQRYGFRGTFYIVSNFVGQPGYMGWGELAGLRDAGMELGSHSVSHPNLTELDATELAHQILQSKADLEQNLHIHVTSFCYPSGAYNLTTEEQVGLAGFENATTTRWDNDDTDIFALPRRRVSGNTSAEAFGWIVSN